MDEKIDKQLGEVADLKNALKDLTTRIDDITAEAKGAKSLKEFTHCECTFVDGKLITCCPFHEDQQKESNRKELFALNMLAVFEEIVESVDVGRAAIRSLSYHYLRIGELIQHQAKKYGLDSKIFHDFDVPDAPELPEETTEPSGAKGKAAFKPGDNGLGFVMKNRNKDIIPAEDNGPICFKCALFEGCDLIDEDLQELSPACGKYVEKEGKSG